MREIKFRVHDADTGEILAYEHFNTSLNWGYYWLDAKELAEKGGEAACYAPPEYFKHPQPLGRLIRVLYTGLHDRNGKEYYAEDIFILQTTRHIVRWNEEKAGWYLCWSDGGFSQPFNKILAESGENIGNTYENPELLESEQCLTQ